MTDPVEYINQWHFQQKYRELCRFISRVTWIEKLDFYTLNLDEWKQPDFPRMRLDIEFALGDDKDVLKLVADHNMNAVKQRETYLAKLKVGHRLLLGRQNEEIVFYLWVVSGKKEMMDKYLLLKADEVAIERGYTRKEYRGHGLFNYGVCYLFPLLAAEGFRNCLTEISGLKRSIQVITGCDTPFDSTSFPGDLWPSDS